MLHEIKGPELGKEGGRKYTVGNEEINFNELLIQYSSLIKTANLGEFSEAKLGSVPITKKCYGRH